eukprot:jgi/Botrbrau1/20751/Bobra.0058s0079.1
MIGEQSSIRRPPMAGKPQEPVHKGKPQVPQQQVNDGSLFDQAFKRLNKFPISKYTRLSWRDQGTTATVEVWQHNNGQPIAIKRF